MTSTYNEKSCSKEKDLAWSYSDCWFTSLTRFMEGHTLFQAGPLKKAVQKAPGCIAGQHFNHMYCAEKCRLEATETIDYFNTKFGKSFWLKMWFAFKTFHFYIIQMLGNISFQNALKCKYLKTKTFLKWKSSQRQHLIQKHLPPFSFSFSSAKSQFFTGPPGNLREN